jgi:hypothetical protein
MATRAERSRSDGQRTHGAGRHKSHVSERKLKKADWSHDKAHAASKATHALEDTAPGERPSRESTRGSSNRAKADSAFNLTEQTKNGSPYSVGTLTTDAEPVYFVTPFATDVAPETFARFCGVFVQRYAPTDPSRSQPASLVVVGVFVP